MRIGKIATYFFMDGKPRLWHSMVALLFVLFWLASCTPMHNYGYPHRLRIGVRGGTRVIAGWDTFYDIDITDRDGNGASYQPFYGERADSLTALQQDSLDYWPDSIAVTYQWLTVKSAWCDNKLTLIAEPNTTGKSRSLWVALWIMDSFAEIKIVQ